MPYECGSGSREEVVLWIRLKPGELPPKEQIRVSAPAAGKLQKFKIPESMRHGRFAPDDAERKDQEAACARLEIQEQAWKKSRGI